MAVFSFSITQLKVTKSDQSKENEPFKKRLCAWKWNDYVHENETIICMKMKRLFAWKWNDCRFNFKTFHNNANSKTF
jgi:hypothetical protein